MYNKIGSNSNYSTKLCTMHTYKHIEHRAAILTTATPQFSVIAFGKILYILGSDFSENQFRASTLLLQNCTFSRYV